MVSRYSSRFEAPSLAEARFWNARVAMALALVCAYLQVLNLSLMASMGGITLDMHTVWNVLLPFDDMFLNRYVVAANYMKRQWNSFGSTYLSTVRAPMLHVVLLTLGAWSCLLAIAA